MMFQKACVLRYGKKKKKHINLFIKDRKGALKFKQILLILVGLKTYFPKYNNNILATFCIYCTINV